MADNLIDYLPYKTICIEFGLICELPEIATNVHFKGYNSSPPLKKIDKPSKNLMIQQKCGFF